MLADRLEALKERAEYCEALVYFQSNPENFGFAGGLRCAVAIMSGVDYQPLTLPETWQNGTPPQTDLKTAEDLRRCSGSLRQCRGALSEEKNKTETLAGRLDLAQKRIAQLEDVISGFSSRKTPQ